MSPMFSPQFYHWFQLLSIFELSDFQSQKQLKSFFFQPEHPVKPVGWLTWLQTNPETCRIMKSEKKSGKKTSWKNSPPCWRTFLRLLKSLLSQTLILWVFKALYLSGCTASNVATEDGRGPPALVLTSGAKMQGHAMYIHTLWIILSVSTTTTTAIV